MRAARPPGPSRFVSFDRVEDQLMIEDHVDAQSYLFSDRLRNVFRAIYDLGDRYSGYVTAEYHPTDLSFRDLERVKQLASFGPQS